MKQLLILTLALAAHASYAQTVFFTSPQKFDEKELDNFYSSIIVQDSLVIFNANNYTIYAYDKVTGKEVWNYYLRRKSNLLFATPGLVWTNATEDEGLILGMDGKIIKQLPFTVYSQPYIKDDHAYLTGIFEAGNILAYHMKADTVSWYKFIAHGCDVKPYYLPDRILANAESNYWLEMDYAGNLLQKCDQESEEWDGGIHCTEAFSFISHDGKRFSGKASEVLNLEEYERPKTLTIAGLTFILNEGRLSILGKKSKILFSEELHHISAEVQEDNWEYSSLLDANEKEARLVYNKKLIVFDVKKKQIKSVTDLSPWRPHQVVAEGNNLWIISKEDGLLYGITI